MSCMRLALRARGRLLDGSNSSQPCRDRTADSVRSGTAGCRSCPGTTACYTPYHHRSPLALYLTVPVLPACQEPLDEHRFHAASCRPGREQLVSVQVEF